MKKVIPILIFLKKCECEYAKDRSQLQLVQRFRYKEIDTSPVLGIRIKNLFVSIAANAFT